jgi:hypothetical protein
MAQNASPFMLKIFRILPTVEIVSLAAVFISIVLKRYGIAGTDMLLMFSLQSLAGVFFLSAFTPLSIQNDESSPMGFKELLAYVIVPKVLGVASAVATMGILFYLLGIRRYDLMLFIGGSTLAGGCVILGFAILTGIKHVNVLMPFLYRAVPLFLISAYILFQL